MQEVIFTSRQEQTDSLVLECELTQDSFGLLIALGNDKFADDFSDWDMYEQDTYVAEIDLQVYACFEFEEFSDINNLEDLKQRLSDWQLKAFEESYKSKIDTGLSLIKKKLLEKSKN